MDIKWMLEDSVYLKNDGRKAGSLCLLLCLIDSLAKQNYPNENSNKRRYKTYLKEKLKAFNIDISYRIEERNQLIHISEIIYAYFRCYLVHEGDDRTHDDYEVQLEFETSGKFKFNAGVLIDRITEKFIIRVDWLIEMLEQIAHSELV